MCRTSHKSIHFLHVHTVSLQIWSTLNFPPYLQSYYNPQFFKLFEWEIWKITMGFNVAACKAIQWDTSLNKNAFQ